MKRRVLGGSGEGSGILYSAAVLLIGEPSTHLNRHVPRRCTYVGHFLFYRLIKIYNRLNLIVSTYYYHVHEINVSSASSQILDATRYQSGGM